MAETSLHLSTQASRVFLVHTRKAPACLPTPNARSNKNFDGKLYLHIKELLMWSFFCRYLYLHMQYLRMWAACLRRISGMNYTARYCKHIGVADAYRAILGTDEIHCLRSLILETIVKRMYRRSWQLVQQTVALVCQPYVYQYLA